MTSKLFILLNEIDPKYISDKISMLANNAINTFNLKSNIVTDESDFQKICANFYCHMENTVIESNPPRKLHFAMDWGRFHKKLMMIYGENGHYTAFDITRSGNENGLYGVLKAVADKMIGEYAGNNVKVKICDFWDGLTIDEKFLAINEYIENFGHLLPKEIVEDGAPRIVSNFLKVLEEHPRMLKRTRNIGNKF